MKHILNYTFFVLLLLLEVSCSPQASKEKTKPDIIVFMIEDMSVQIPAYGDRTVATPNIDALASRGAIYKNAYAAQATCSPSRSSFFTGLYPHQNGHMLLADSYGGHLHEGTPSIISILKEKGYYTGLNYKIHVNPENAMPFDQHYGKESFKRENSHPKDGVKGAEFLRRFLRTRPKDKPFFFQAQTDDTHRPFLYDNDEGLNKHRIRLDYEGSPYKILTKEDVKPIPSFGEAIAQTDVLMDDVSAYYNAIQRADRAVGLFLEVLEEEGVDLDNTFIILTADHGPPYGRGKCSVYELGMRVPLILAGKNLLPKGTVKENLVSFVDLFPTILDVANIPQPEYLPGNSLLKTFQDDNDWPEAVFGEYFAHTTIDDYWPSRMVRKGNYKLIWNLKANTNLKGGVHAEGSPDVYTAVKSRAGEDTHTIYKRFNTPPEYELYNLENDPYEKVNLAMTPEYQQKLTELQSTLTKWMQTTADPLSDKNTFNKLDSYFTKKQLEVDQFRRQHPDEDVWQHKRFLQGDLSFIRKPWEARKAELIRAKKVNKN
ncbi:sulfatase [Aureibaculum sp. 2210JD6-5]|uniref:sulfatase family protein n=1 Tax=Aureibaculum sp. 2210JD6-5 TaxID=3103957 RepID=UPI002AAE945F|nr:sulfatase [Aureibaculum sp. 2210JD6-5]MDY7396317.1 sulfatase [Aureibaculum sp. 2210JD6-5]